MGLAFKGDALMEMEQYWIKIDLYEKKNKCKRHLVNLWKCTRHFMW